MTKGFEKWGELPLNIVEVDSVQGWTKGGYCESIISIQPDQMEKMADSKIEAFAVRAGELFLHLNDTTKEVSVRYTTFHQKTLRRPRKKR